MNNYSALDFYFSNRQHNSLHFLSVRCSSFNNELLKVNLADIPYSSISERTSFTSAFPKLVLPPPQREPSGAP